MGPNSSNFEEFFTVANFLGYGNNLKVVKPITGLVNVLCQLVRCLDQEYN